MEWLALAVALGADTFSVSLGLGVDNPTPRRLLLVPLFFGAVQGILVSGGYGVARGVHWLFHRFPLAFDRGLFGGFERFHAGLHVVFSLVGALALLALGVRLAFPGRSRGEGMRIPFFRGRIGLILLALSVNLDSVTAGWGLGMLERELHLFAAAGMALVGGGLSGLGLKAGKRFGEGLGRFAQPIGGTILIFLALWVAAQTALGG